MLKESKEYKDFVIDSMIKNVVCDEVAFNLTDMPKFNSLADSYVALKEELQETDEELKEMFIELDQLWGMIRANSPDTEVQVKIKVMLEQSYQVIHEAVHIAAVCKKSITQLFEEGEHVRKKVD